MTSPDVRAKLRTNATGRRHTEETKRKIRNATRLRRMSDHDNSSVSKPRHRSPRSRRRTRVPFEYSHDLVAALDSRITSLYHTKLSEQSGFGADSRVRRPMPEETKRKLSERLRKMWADDPEYRQRVHRGIEAHYRNRGPRPPLSEDHKNSIRQSLIKRHIALRAATNGNSSKFGRRRSANDPAEGTRFSERLMTPEDRLALEERRLRTAQAVFDLEEEEDAAFELEEDLRLPTAQKIASQKREGYERRVTNKMLLNSLAQAGQLPSLEEECAMVGPSRGTVSSLEDGVASAAIEFGDEISVPSFESGLSIELPSPIQDPLLVSPASPISLSSLTNGEPNFSDMFVNITGNLDERQSNSHVALESMTSSASESTGTISKASRWNSEGKPKASEFGEKYGEYSRTEKSCVEPKIGDLLDGKDEEKGDVVDPSNFEDTFDFVDDFESMSSSLIEDRLASIPTKRIVQYVNGERVLKELNS